MFIYTYKVLLLPNNKQKSKLLATLNKCIECQNIIFDMLDNMIKSKERIPSCFDVRKSFTQIKKKKDSEQIKETANLTKKQKLSLHKLTLFYDVSNDALKQTVKDTYNSFVRCFKKEADYPRRRRFNDFPKSFYIDPIKICFSDKKVKLEKISSSLKANRAQLNWIKLGEKNRIPVDCKYYNPRVSYDGTKFWLTVSVDDEFRPKKKISNTFDKETIGIDLNINTINLSNGVVYDSVNKSDSVKKEIKKQKILQKALSRKYVKAKEEKRKLSISKNYIKNKIKLHKLIQKIANLKTQHNNQIINSIISFAPHKIVVENLDVKQMQKNHKISSLIQMVAFRKFLQLLKDRLRYIPIEIVEADTYFPSSKMCSCCGHIKKDLKLKDRIYKCDECGMVISRDLNAAINLSKY